MKKIKLNLATSINGKIAREDHNLDWLYGDDKNYVGESEEFNIFLEGVDALVMGLNSHKITTSFGKLSKQFPNKKYYVLNNSEISDKEVSVIAGEPQEIIDQIEEENIWLFGGGNVVSQFLSKNLVDEIHLSIIPAIIKNGISLFQKIEMDSRYKLERTSSSNGVITLIWKNISK